MLHKKQHKLQQRSDQRDRIVRVDFSATQASNGVASTYTQAIHPSGLGPRILSMADSFEFYRVEKLEFRLHPGTDISGLILGACYLGGVTDTVPATQYDMSQVVHHVCLGSVAKMPTNWCVVDARTLAGYCPWYKTLQGTPDVAQEIQGNIYSISGNSSTAVLLEFRGTIAFKGAVPVGSTPMERVLTENRREKQRLLQLLSSSTEPTDRGVVSSALPQVGTSSGSFKAPRADRY
jgi:hypothetical protein